LIAPAIIIIVSACSKRIIAVVTPIVSTGVCGKERRREKKTGVR